MIKTFVELIAFLLILLVVILFFVTSFGVSNRDLRVDVRTASATVQDKVDARCDALEAKIDQLGSKLDRLESKLDLLIERATPRLPDDMKIAE